MTQNNKINMQSNTNDYNIINNAQKKFVMNARWPQANGPCYNFSYNFNFIF